MKFIISLYFPSFFLVSFSVRKKLALSFFFETVPLRYDSNAWDHVREILSCTAIYCDVSVSSYKRWYSRIPIISQKKPFAFKSSTLIFFSVHSVRRTVYNDRNGLLTKSSPGLHFLVKTLAKYLEIIFHDNSISHFLIIALQKSCHSHFSRPFPHFSIHFSIHLSILQKKILVSICWEKRPKMDFFPQSHILLRDSGGKHINGMKDVLLLKVLEFVRSDWNCN